MSLNSSNRLEFSNYCLGKVSTFFRKIPVLKRAYPILLKFWAYMTWTKDYKVNLYKGSLFTLNFRNHVDRCIALHGGFEVKQTDYLFSQAKRNGCDIFLDIGANLGLYTLQAVQESFVKTIHAFEPDPRNYAQLHGNLYLNKAVDSVQVYKKGLSNIVGELCFELSPERSTGQTHIFEGDNTATLSGQIVNLPVTMLDTIFSIKGNKVFIKIDVEGHEEKVIKGGENFLRNNKCFIQMEIWPEKAEQMQEQMESLGYNCINRIDEDYYFTNFE